MLCVQSTQKLCNTKSLQIGIENETVFCSVMRLGIQQTTEIQKNWVPSVELLHRQYIPAIGYV